MRFACFRLLDASGLVSMNRGKRRRVEERAGSGKISFRLSWQFPGCYF
jgi:hypothetical protein